MLGVLPLPVREGSRRPPLSPCAANAKASNTKAGALALVITFGLTLAGCSSSLLSVGAPPAAMPGAPRQAQQQPPQPAAAPSEREHQRILAAYNGAYEDPRLEGLLNQTVEKLVAASERPDLHYRVTVLNSFRRYARPVDRLSLPLKQ